MWITYFFKEFIGIWQANIFLPFKTEIYRYCLKNSGKRSIIDVKLTRDMMSMEYSTVKDVTNMSEITEWWAPLLYKLREMYGAKILIIKELG